LVGTSEPFVLQANKWMNVPISNLPYSGTFYAMVHWSFSAGYSHYIGYDNTGSNADKELDMLLTADGSWYILNSLTWEAPGVFMIRANANIFGKKVSYHEYEPAVQPVVFSKSEMHGVAHTSGTIVAPECTRPELREPTRSFEKYIVYRLTENQPESEWVLLADNVTGTTYIDNSWETLPSGRYQYAVRAKYTGEVISVAKLTNRVNNKMECDYQINISTNSGDPVTGAIIRLTHKDGNAAHDYTKISGATGATFSNAWVGTYNLKITLNGHQDYTNVVAITGAGESHTAQLIEIINTPDILKIEVNCEEKNALFEWEVFQPFFDDIENYQDFIIENIGDYTLYNLNDDNTWGVEGFDYQNQYEPHAFQVFNPLKTSPPMTHPSVAPHSGSKYFVSFSKYEGANDDWLILPKLKIANGAKFSFWARSYILAYPERIRVLVSTTGVNAPADFKLISEGDYIDLPEEWTYYSYDLSAFAKQEIYLAINCVSVEGFFMMLDDIAVEKGKSASKSLTGYRIYLDGNEIELTTQKNYLFTNVNEGTHTAGVKAVYSSGESEMATIDFIGCEEIGVENSILSELRLFPNPFSNEIQISHPDLVNSVQITDILGQKIKNTTYNGKSINTENLSSGIYIITLETLSGEKMIYKMVKE